MHNVFILGYSEAVLSMILETLLARNYRSDITIVANTDIEKRQEFIPPGMNANIIKAGEWISAGESNLMFGVASPRVKKLVFASFRDSHQITENGFISLLHPSSVMAASVRISNGCYIEPGSVVSPFAKLGFGVTINRGVTIGHHTEIGRLATVNPGVHIAGNCAVGEEAQIGIGTVVFEKVRIGEGSVIGGGSVVTGDIPAHVTAWGNPCRVVKNH